MLVVLEQLIIKFVSFSSSVIIIIIFYFAKFIGKVVPQWTEKMSVIILKEIVKNWVFSWYLWDPLVVFRFGYSGTTTLHPLK